MLLLHNKAVCTKKLHAKIDIVFKMYSLKLFLPNIITSTKSLNLGKSLLLALFPPVNLCRPCQEIIIQQPWSSSIAVPLRGFYCIHMCSHRVNSFILQVLLLGPAKNILVHIFRNK